jgi:sugar phosphate isomerase/epimerase
LTAWDLLDKIRSLGLAVLQICDNVPLIDWDRSSLQQLREAAQRQGVILELGARGLNVDNLRAYLDIAAALQAHLLRIVPWAGSRTEHGLPIDRLYAVVDQLLPFCQEHDIMLAIENHFDVPDQDLAEFVRQVNHVRVGVCLDTANSTGFLQKPLETAKMLAPYVVSLHLKDFVVTKKPGIGYWISGVPLGQGWLDIPAVLDIVDRAGRQPNVLLELWMAPAETHEATLHQEEDWVRQSVAHARDQLGIGRIQA